MMYAHKTQSGFSLVEMLVAVSVLLIIIVGPMTMTSRVAKSSSFATEQVQAFFLAQEGLELAEKLRDDLLLRHFNSSYATPWTTFNNPAGTNNLCYIIDSGDKGCGIDWNNIGGPFRDCNTASNCKLNYKPDATRSKYTYDTAVPIEETPFTRFIVFENSGSNAVKVTSIVTWRTGSLTTEQRVETSTYLYNIYDKN
jgi:prepilin-type N-terminal cleavage/methylation domain-containing protein